MRQTKRGYLTAVGAGLLVVLFLAFPETYAQVGNSVRGLLMQVVENTDAIQAKTDTLPAQPAGQFETGVTKAVKGQIEADPPAGGCDFTFVVSEGTDSVISGRVGIGVNSALADFAQAEGSLGGVRFPFTEVGSLAEPPAASSNVGFISDGVLTITICDFSSDGEDGPTTVRYNALYTVTENVAESF